MTRKAKIIATLGNSTEEILEYIIEKGADAVLILKSHSSVHP